MCAFCKNVPVLALIVTKAKKTNPPKKKKNCLFIKHIIWWYSLYFWRDLSTLDCCRVLSQIAGLLQSSTLNLQYVIGVDCVQNVAACVTTKTYSREAKIRSVKK